MKDVMAYNKVTVMFRGHFSVQRSRSNALVAHKKGTLWHHWGKMKYYFIQVGFNMC